jgi:hypothetical protein
MEFRRHLWTLVLFVTAATMCWAQTEGGQTADGHAPAPASANDAPLGTLPEADQGPGLERRSFFLAGLHIAENAETVPGYGVGNPSQISSLTNAFGSLNWLSLRRRSQTAIDYLGGAEFYSDSTLYGSTVTQVQQLNIVQSFLWRRAELTFEDEFGTLPGADFGSSWFGGAGLYNLDTVGVSANLPTPSSLSNFFGSTVLGGFGGSHVSNVSLAEYTDVLTRRSSMTVIGGYGITDYSGSPGLINSQVTGAQASYDYQLNLRNHVGFSYGFRSLRFPQSGEGNIDTNSFELIYGRKASARITFALGIGPEFVRISIPLSASTNQINLSGNASVSYLLRKETFRLGCDKLVTSGSGLYAGANSDTCQLSVIHPVRRWSTSLYAGYAKLSPFGQILNGYQTQAYQYGFVGAGINRELGRHLSAFAGYQYQSQSFSSSLSICTVSSDCNLIARHIFSVGIDLRTRPKRSE